MCDIHTHMVNVNFIGPISMNGILFYGSLVS